MRLTTLEVLEAIPKAAAPWSGYIADQIIRSHNARVRAGGVGHPPRVSLILSRLRDLEGRGLIKCTGGPKGYYGYIWEITDAGRLALAEAERGRK